MEKQFWFDVIYLRNIKIALKKYNKKNNERNFRSQVLFRLSMYII